MQLIEKHQDLFQEKDNTVIGHCVSLDDNLAMGIAKQFKKNYPEYAHYFFSKSYQGQLKIGTADLFMDKKHNTIIFSLINKSHYSSKPHLKQMKLCLIDLRNKMAENNLATINLPKIGAGIDYKGFASTQNKAWKIIKKTIEEVFQNTNITIIINKK